MTGGFKRIKGFNRSNIKRAEKEARKEMWQMLYANNFIFTKGVRASSDLQMRQWMRGAATRHIIHVRTDESFGRNELHNFWGK